MRRILDRQIASIPRALNTPTKAIRASGKLLQRIFSYMPMLFQRLQIPLFGVVTNVKADLDETGRDLIVQRRGRADRRVSSSGRQPTQTLIWFPK